MSTSSAPAPAVSAIIKAADASAPAVPIADGIWMSPDISNSYLIASDDGAIVINAGTVAGGAVHRMRYDDLGVGPYRHLVLTQAHPDHYAGSPKFPGVPIIAEQRFPENFAYREALVDYYVPRTARIWRALIGSARTTAPNPLVTPSQLVRGSAQLQVGNRRLELLSVPGGETTCSLAVWLPAEKILFTGNLLGPAYLTLPNLNPIRTDRPRSAMEYLRSLEIVLALGAEMLVTGHGEPIHGADRIRRDLTRTRDCVRSIHDQTFAGMNAGKSVEELMATVRMPEDLKLSEGYGSTAWCVRTIYEEYTGWFHQDYTTGLYHVPRKAVAGELVGLAGADALAAAAAAHLDGDRPLEALHLVELLLDADPRSAPALRLKVAALGRLLEAAKARDNLNETMWLRSETAAAEDELAQI